MQCFLCVSVWARCVGLPRFSREQILPFAAALNPMASCSLHRFPTPPRCGAPPLSSQDYTSLLSTLMRRESFPRLPRQIFFNICKLIAFPPRGWGGLRQFCQVEVTTWKQSSHPNEELSNIISGLGLVMIIMRASVFSSFFTCALQVVFVRIYTFQTSR